MKQCVCLILAVSYCLDSEAAAASLRYADALIRGIPHVRQRDDFCGEACAEMVLRWLGKTGDQNYVFNISGLDPAEGRGCYSADLARALARIGFKTGNVFYDISVAQADEEIEAQWKLLHADLLKNIPSIVCMHSDASPTATEHMRLVVGYDLQQDEVIYLDPAVRGVSYQRIKRALFLSLWPLKYEASQWLIVRFRMEAGDIQEPTTTAGISNAEYAQHILDLKKRLPEGFSLFLERPFVVVGDGAPEEVKAICQGTVRWAVARLKRDYFARDPEDIITIWLFKDDASYRKYTKSVFNDEPTTPFGYYSAGQRALIMNIETGTGTLVHEIVHPFVRANFSNCPAWLNEGLGSLYEQCGDRDGHIVGYTNWRLAGLQKTIRAGTVPAFQVLTSTTDAEFYQKDKGTNYAQARYLCYYLQREGKLTTFYHEFAKHHADDPTGYRTLVTTLGERDMQAFQAKWEKFVLGLRFP